MSKKSLPIIDPPEWLTEEAADHWRRYAPMAAEVRTLTNADVAAFTILCESCADMTYLQRVIREEGVTIAGAGENKKAHPALRQLESCRAHILALLKEFGLTAKSRKLVKQEPEPKGYDPYDHLEDGFESAPPRFRPVS